MRTVVRRFDVGNYTVVAEVAGNTGGLEKFDVTTFKSGNKIKEDTGCLGEKSLDYWFGNAVTHVRKLAILECLLMTFDNPNMIPKKSTFCIAPSNGIKEVTEKSDMAFIEAWLNTELAIK